MCTSFVSLLQNILHEKTVPTNIISFTSSFSFQNINIAGNTKNMFHFNCNTNLLSELDGPFLLITTSIECQRVLGIYQYSVELRPILLHMKAPSITIRILRIIKWVLNSLTGLNALQNDLKLL